MRNNRSKRVRPVIDNESLCIFEVSRENNTFVIRDVGL
jgi:hypothetical protein